MLHKQNLQASPLQLEATFEKSSLHWLHVPACEGSDDAQDELFRSPRVRFGGGCSIDTS